MAICRGAHLVAGRCNVCRLRQPIGQVAGGSAEAIGSGGDRDINIPHYSRSCYLTRPERNKSKLNLTCRLSNNPQLLKVLYVLFDTSLVKLDFCVYCMGCGLEQVVSIIFGWWRWCNLFHYYVWFYCCILL